MSDFLASLDEAVQSLGRYGDKRKPSIKTGSVDRMFREIERRVGKVFKETSEPISSLKFCGIEVFENQFIPPHIVVVLMDDEIVDIINFGHGEAPSPSEPAGHGEAI